MLGHNRTLTHFASFLIVLVILLLTAGSASAQTPKGLTDQPSVKASPVQPGAGPASTNGIASNSEADPTVPVTDSLKSEADAKGATADPPKSQPMTLPQPLATPTPTPTPAQCQRMTSADVVALPQPIMLNRLGAAVPDGFVFALKGDTVTTGNQIWLRPGKRPRPIVLRANVGDCLTINFTNAIPPASFASNKAPQGQPVGTTEVSLHVEGMEWVTSSMDDGSFVGKNNSSLASTSPPPANMPPSTQKYTLFARQEGTFLLYTTGDSSTQGLQQMRGLFGAMNVQPAGADWYRSQVTADDLTLATYNANSLPSNATLNAGCTSASPCTLTVKNIKTGTSKQVKVLNMPGGYLNTLDNHPLINYDAVYPAKRADGTPIPELQGTPILNMLDTQNNQNKIVHSDLTAIITGPNAGRFPGSNGNPDQPDPPCNVATGTVAPLFCQNPVSPDRKQPYREVTIIYHEMMNAVTAQAFPVSNDNTSPNGLQGTLAAGKDAFAINYGTGGIAAEVYANRIGVGPMGDCVDCKFEEFFLSAWSVGDPAMLVDYPANSNNLAQTGVFEPPCGLVNNFVNNTPCTGTRTPASGTPYTMQPKVQATVAFFPDDPSNVYHSYINDHVKFRILHGGTGVSHVHHQHAHQWLQSPNSDEGSYLDSQMISPGASYTLEMVYNGSGNRNKVVGDSIFHCHFYPHFASGMWSLWRTHDVFESGTFVYPKSSPKAGQVVAGSRALPDGEIIAGVPTPAIVPVPTLPMAPLPAYAQIQNNVTVQGAPTKFGGQVVIGGTCQGNKINGLTVTGGCTDGQVLNGTVINNQFNGTQMTGQFQPSAGNKLINPGFPYFIPGIAGARAPHPPLDFAPDLVNGGFLDGGLPRHLVFGGSIGNEQHNKLDWSKDLATMNAVALPEDGTDVEKAAIAFFHNRCYATFFPDGTPGSCPSSLSTPPQSTLNTPPTGFILNGLPLGPQSGAPFADPAIDDNGQPVGTKRIYKAAAIQMNVVFNKKALGWHYPQQRLLTLWQDVSPTIATTRPPEPLFFRGNSGDIIEYWHTNLVPNYYQVDDFQVRTPTDILGQHIHLVKFDVTSSDGAGNGFNYEDGTFSPEEVQEIHEALTKPGGSWIDCPGCSKLRDPQPPPAAICSGSPIPPQCTKNPKEWWGGAQTTIQRWYLDPLVDDNGVDRTLRTVFTHDHFGPSTHQQAGLYAGLLVEPQGSTWKNSEDGTTMGQRPDGGPTSWKADIWQQNQNISYREFALEFQDFVLAYQVNQLPGQAPPKFANPNTPPDPVTGYMDPAYAIGAPDTPTLISTLTVGGQSVNYRNEPIPWRAQVLDPAGFPFGDLSNAFDSDIPQQTIPGTNPTLTTPLLTGDPFTPLMRAYQGDKVQIRLLVGAHMFAHQFNLQGPTWFAEPSWTNSGYRSVQAMGLSEHFEFLFNVPSTSAPKKGVACPDKTSTGSCIDYLYSPSFDEFGLSNGMWGLFRSYSPTVAADKLQPLPNNSIGPSAKVDYATCPAGAPVRTYNITAVTAQKALAVRTPTPEDSTKGQIVFNDRGGNANALRAKLGIMYVLTEDLDAQGRLKGSNATTGAPIEPLILRANAGDCIVANLTNGIANNSDLFTQPFPYAQPLTGQFAPSYLAPRASKLVGLHPQLLSYDAAVSNGLNVGHNRITMQGDTQVVKSGVTRAYQWYAGKIERDATTGTLNYTPVEFGSLNLFPSDPMYQNSNGLFGSMVIEPQGSTWTCDAKDGTGKLIPVPCAPAPGFDPTTAKSYTRASANVTLADNTTKFREFVPMISDAMRISQNNSSAVNYKTEPQEFRYAGNGTSDFSCMLSNKLIQQAQNDPQTPIFTADIGAKVRFRMAHPFGTGTSQVFTLHGHVWQRNPYVNNSQQIGNNNLSQWLGSRDNHGASDHFELVVDKAGGEGGRAGDYLYTVYLPGQARLGAWGLFRVGQSSVAVPSNAACQPAAPGAAPASISPAEQPDLKGLIRQPISEDPKP